MLSIQKKNKKRTYRQNPKTIVKTTLNIQEHLKKLTHTQRGKKKEEKIKTGTRKEESIQANKHIHSEKLKTRLPKGKRKHRRKHNIVKEYSRNRKNKINLFINKCILKRKK